MSTALATKPGANMEGLEAVLLEGDLSRLSAEQRVQYYSRVCESVGLNPLTSPFEYLKLNGKTILYAKRACTDQLRQIHRISVTVTSREKVDGIYVVTARATTPDGRTDESIGAVPVEGLKGENYANALMKSETKAKRRVTLAICGLSMMDELEVESVQKAERPKTLTRTLDDVAHDADGVVVDAKPAKPAYETDSRGTYLDTSKVKPAYSVDAHIKSLELCKKKHLQAWLAKFLANERTEEQEKIAEAAFSAKCMLEGVDAEQMIAEAT